MRSLAKSIYVWEKFWRQRLVPKSNKLLKLKIDIGEERTIVAGIGKDYTPAELIGRKIVIVANLKAGKINGSGILRHAFGYRYG